MKKALIIVDVQNDFCEGGALAVEDGTSVAAPVNMLAERFASAGLPIFFTRDWHPADHISFAEQGGVWPVHCVAGETGAEFIPQLKIPRESVVISKATTRLAEAYSGFEGTDLGERLASLKVESVVVAGIATDYCVKSTVLDALRLGFACELVTDAVRAVNANDGDGERAVSEMRAAGASLVTSKEVSV